VLQSDLINLVARGLDFASTILEFLTDIRLSLKNIPSIDRTFRQIAYEQKLEDIKEWMSITPMSQFSTVPKRP